MFCMGCGAEAPFGAARCPVCGRDLGGNNGDARDAPRVARSLAPAGAPPASPSSTSSYQSIERLGSLSLGAGAGAAASGQNLPGLPRDTHGRVALATAIAMAVDLLLPWAVVNGEHRAIATIGALALLALPLLAAAALPLFNPALRRKPIYAVLPLIVGALCVGAGCTLWATFTYLSYKLVFFSAANPGDFSSSGTGFILSLSPDVGLYLFILGGAVLAFTGYHIFVATAARASSMTVPASRVAASMPMPPRSSAHAILPTVQPQPRVATALAPASISLTPSMQLSSSAVTDSSNGVPASPIPPATEQSVPSLDSASAPAQAPPPILEKSRHNGAGAAPSDVALHVPLPGSAEWNETPRQPAYMRPALGWQRGPRVRH